MPFASSESAIFVVVQKLNIILKSIQKNTVHTRESAAIIRASVFLYNKIQRGVNNRAASKRLPCTLLDPFLSLKSRKLSKC